MNNNDKKIKKMHKQIISKIISRVGETKNGWCNLSIHQHQLLHLDSHKWLIIIVFYSSSSKTTQLNFYLFKY